MISGNCPYGKNLAINCSLRPKIEEGLRAVKELGDRIQKKTIDPEIARISIIKFEDKVEEFRSHTRDHCYCPQFSDKMFELELDVLGLQSKFIEMVKEKPPKDIGPPTLMGRIKKGAKAVGIGMGVMALFTALAFVLQYDPNCHQLVAPVEEIAKKGLALGLFVNCSMLFFEMAQQTNPPPQARKNHRRSASI